MKIILPTILFLLMVACSGLPKLPEPTGYETYSRESYVLGPEAFEFCDGWVEFWGQIDRSQKLSFFIKATPPSGKSWMIWNQDITIEHPHLAQKKLAFGEVKVLEVGKGIDPKNSSLMNWDVDLQGLNPEAGIEVSLKSFDGCQGEESLKGVVLTPSF